MHDANDWISQISLNFGVCWFIESLLPTLWSREAWPFAYYASDNNWIKFASLNFTCSYLVCIQLSHLYSSCLNILCLELACLKRTCLKHICFNSICLSNSPPLKPKHGGKLIIIYRSGLRVSFVHIQFDQ